MIGIVIVRQGVLNAGAGDVAASADEVWLLGSGIDSLERWPQASRAVDLGEFGPAAYTEYLTHAVGENSVVLAAEPDGRDIAGRLGEVLGRPVLAGCLELSDHRAVVPRYGSATTAVIDVTGPVVATVQVDPVREAPVGVALFIEHVAVDRSTDPDVVRIDDRGADGLDLMTSPLVLGGGAGLEAATDFGVLAQVATRLGGAMGATRVITDRGWTDSARQIGTTGVTIRPQIYLAFGVSGAVQHTAGLGAPEHVVSVNLDDACPMSQMADLVVVADASATLAALAQIVEQR